jgi:hypothetical protein
MPSSPLASTKYTWHYWRAQCPALPLQVLNMPGIIGEPNAQLSWQLLNIPGITGEPNAQLSPCNY